MGICASKSKNSKPIILKELNIVKQNQQQIICQDEQIPDDNMQFFQDALNSQDMPSNQPEKISIPDKQFDDESQKQIRANYQPQKCIFCKDEKGRMNQLKCGHYYHNGCLSQQEIKDDTNCICGQKITIQISPSEIQKINILKVQLKTIIQKNKQYIFIKCEKVNCFFFFIYDQEKSQQLDYYCPECQKIYTIQQTQISCYYCNQKLNSEIISLDCQHNYHQQCLYQQIEQSLSLLCKCGQKIYKKQSNLNNIEFFQDLYKQQLFRIFKTILNQIYCYCHSCHFICIYDEKINEKLKYCVNCDNKCEMKMIANGNIFEQCCECNKTEINLITLQCGHKFDNICLKKILSIQTSRIKNCKCGFNISNQNYDNFFS